MYARLSKNMIALRRGRNSSMSEKNPECPLYNPFNCKEYYNPKLCAFSKKDKICLKKKKPSSKEPDDASLETASPEAASIEAASPEE